MNKKISALLAAIFFLTLTVLSGCSSHLLENEDAQFESYTQALFCHEVSANTITLHYTLHKPESYDIKDTPITFGTCTTDTKALHASLENAHAALSLHKRQSLSDQNQLTYDVLNSYFIQAKKEVPYTLYEEPLAPMTGTQSQLPVLLSEYQFNNTKDVDTYLTLLSKIPEYFESLIAFEETKSKKGLFMASYTADSIIEECNAFIVMGEDHYLFSSFADRIQKLKLSEQDTNSYLTKNNESIKKNVFPSYKMISDMLFRLRTSGSNNNGLCYLPDGKAYYQLKANHETGSNRTIPKLQELTRQQMKEDLLSMQHILSSSPPDSATPSPPLLADSNPLSILSDLKSKLVASFPAPPNVDTKVKYVQKSMQEYLSPAFYMVPAIDNNNNNTIYINQGHLLDDISLYTTLAHEGYPGHLYQTVYFQNQNPDPIRNLLSCSGYTEGWATYSEMMSYYYAPIPEEQALLLQKNASVILGIYALADMGIHYDGWKLTDAVSFFRQYGITDVMIIENIYDLIISDPGNYLKYYIGYVEFLELKKEAIKKWGSNFTQLKFHKAVLKAGPISFDILRKYLFK